MNNTHVDLDVVLDDYSKQGIMWHVVKAEKGQGLAISVAVSAESGDLIANMLDNRDCTVIQQVLIATKHITNGFLVHSDTKDKRIYIILQTLNRAERYEYVEAEGGEYILSNEFPCNPEGLLVLEYTAVVNKSIDDDIAYENPSSKQNAPETTIEYILNDMEQAIADLKTSTDPDKRAYIVDKLILSTSRLESVVVKN